MLLGWNGLKREIRITSKFHNKWKCLWTHVEGHRGSAWERQREREQVDKNQNKKWEAGGRDKGLNDLSSSR